VERYVPYPVRVPDLGDVVAVRAGNHHSLALLKDGTVRAWGLNKHGQIGDGTRTNRDRPLTVPGVRNAVAIATGWYRSAALLPYGTVIE
jgi:alpha-tubulin suppressor-like RCC1 family protein